MIATFGIGSTRLRSALGTSDGKLVTDIHAEPTRPHDLPNQVLSRIESLATTPLLEQPPSPSVPDALSTDRSSTDRSSTDSTSTHRRSGDPSSTDRRSRFDDPTSIDAVSISCAGLIDATTGIVREIDTPDGSVVRDVPLGPIVADAHAVPVHLENDCTAAALAEWTYGAGRTADCVVHVTIGTGIGAGVVDRGHVIRGAHGHAAEVGLFPIAPTDRKSTGVDGAWEAYCSGRGIASYVSDRLKDETRETALFDRESIAGPDSPFDPDSPSDPDSPFDPDSSTGSGILTAKEVFAAVAAGDAVANEYLDQIARYNAAGFGTIVNAYNPDLITVGGGVGLSNFETLYERMAPHIERFSLPEVPTIETTTLGDEIGLYGALAPFAGETDARQAARIAASSTDD